MRDMLGRPVTRGSSLIAYMPQHGAVAAPTWAEIAGVEPALRQLERHGCRLADRFAAALRSSEPVGLNGATSPPPMMDWRSGWIGSKTDQEGKGASIGPPRGVHRRT